MRHPTPNADDIAKFKALYFEDYGSELSDDKALRELIRMLHIFPMVATPQELKAMGGAKFIFNNKTASRD